MSSATTLNPAITPANRQRSAWALAIAASYALAAPAASAATPIGLPIEIGQPGLSASHAGSASSGHGDFVVLLYEGNALIARRFATDGSLLGDSLVTSTVSKVIRFPSIAMNSAAAYVVSWREQQGTTFGFERIFAQAYAAGGQPLGRVEVATDTNLEAPQRSSIAGDVAIDDDGDFTVAWREERTSAPIPIPIGYAALSLETSAIKARRYSSNGTPIGDVATLATSLTDPGLGLPTNRNAPPAVATDAAGDSVVVWASTDGLGMSGVFGRRLGSQGRASGVKFRIDGGGNPRGTGDYAPAIAMNDAGAFVVAWSQANLAPPQLPNVHAIQARRYGPLGVPGPIVAISETRALEEANVDMNAAGDAVVTWAATPAASGRAPLRVQAQTLARDGSRIGGNIAVVDVDGLYATPDVGIDDNGSFVVSWGNAGNAPPRVKAQRYTAP